MLLRVVPHKGVPFDYAPQDDVIVVGRSPDCDLVIEDPYLSRHHARLVRDRDGWRIEDLGSFNGTRVNGERLYGARSLRPGDQVAMCGTKVEVRDPPDYDELTEEPSTLDVPRGDARERSGDSDDSSRFLPAREILKLHPELPDDAGSLGEVRRWSERLRVVHEVHKDLARSLDLTDLLERLLDRVFDHLEPERGVIHLARSQGGFYIAAHRSVDEDTEPLDSTHLVHEVAEKGLAALVLDVHSDERFSEADSLLDLGVRSLIAAPLLEGEESLGMIALDSSLGKRCFEEEDLELLVALASAAALRVRNLALIEDAVERNRLESELAMARRIQVALLPQELPKVDGWTLHGGNLPSRGVSGDVYEVVERTSNQNRELVLLVADVSGKGMAASLLTASLEALLAPLIENGEEPAAICKIASQLLYQRTPPEKFATAIVAALDPRSGELRFASAGHDPALWIRSCGEIERLASTGPPLGLLPDKEFEARTRRLASGDTLLLYTDGLVEAENPQGEPYGLERLVGACRRHAEAAPKDLAHILEETLKTFVEGKPFADDRTLLIVQRR